MTISGLETASAENDRAKAMARQIKVARPGDAAAVHLGPTCPCEPDSDRHRLFDYTWMW